MRMRRSVRLLIVMLATGLSLAPATESLGPPEGATLVEAQDSPACRALRGVRVRFRCISLTEQKGLATINLCPFFRMLSKLLCQ